MASVATSHMGQIDSIALRLKSLVKQLERFSFPLIAQPLAGLLTQPENHTATARIELLLHLAALSCWGNEEPGPRQLRRWLNVTLSKDPVTQLEVPVEDVFVSNVATWFGNARLFNGRWNNNADYVQACVDTLLRVEDNSWAVTASRHVTALLRLSEEIAARSGIARNLRTTSTPKRKIDVSASMLTNSTYSVSFSNHELVAIGVNPTDLDPFVIHAEQLKRLAAQTLGNSSLERRPLVRFNDRTIVALPTAIGASIRRFVIERASASGSLHRFQTTFQLAQFGAVFLLGRADWDIQYIKPLYQDTDDGTREFVGTFDDGGYVHLFFAPDDFGAIERTGLASSHNLADTIRHRIHRRAVQCAGADDYRRGLTVLVHGGIGRKFSASWVDSPPGWHQLSVSAPDFMLLGSETDFTAMRAWKLLQQVAELERMGVVFHNLRGFVHLAAFAYYNDFELVPVNMDLGPIYLHSDFILPLRHKLRTGLDRHAAIAPDGVSYVDVHRLATVDLIDERQERQILISPAHKANGEVLAGVESAGRMWWVYCTQIPRHRWHHDIVFAIIDMVLAWLVRLAAVFEHRLTPLPSNPITFRLRFPSLDSFSQHVGSVERPPSEPTVAIEDGEIAINCTPQYISSFMSARNVGDRLMVAALVRGTRSLLPNGASPGANVTELVDAVIVSDDARFLQMTPSRRPQDSIYDTATLPTLRLPMAEDRAWSRLDLARRAGYTSAPGSIPSCRVSAILEAAVGSAWERIRARLVDLSRESVIERSLLNFVAAQKEHRDWLRSTAAQLALYDGERVNAVATARVLRRDAAGLACRVTAEMALSTSPYGVGAACTASDLDFLIAEVSTLLECAAQRDALRSGLVTGQPAVYANGSFNFEAPTAAATDLLMREHWIREFRDAAGGHDIGIHAEVDEEGDDACFDGAFVAELGLSMEQYQTFVALITSEAVAQKTAHLRLRRQRLLRRLQEVGVAMPDRVFGGLALVPRARWDEQNPENAAAHDWYPWRYNRRLSILRRPLIQLTAGENPTVLVVPSVVAGTLDYLRQAAIGRLPEELFDSSAMRSYVGRAADRLGHAFNRRVAARLNQLKWRTIREVKLTALGGGAHLGDIDILAWRPNTDLVCVVECKSLRFDRTWSEIGERIAEYTPGTVGGKRTRLQKHLDRVAYLRTNRERLSRLTNVPVERLQLRSVLITESLSVMQFSETVREVLDVVADYEQLETALPNP